MTNLFKKLAMVSAIAAAPLTASAVPLTVDGVVFNPGDQFITTSLWETVLTATTDVLSGVGIVTQIDNSGGLGTTWIGGQNDTQLTYFFTGFSVGAWYDASGAKHLQGDEVGFAQAVAIDFLGGSVKVFSDRMSTGTVLNPSAGGSTIPTDIAKATDGNLWLNYVGSSFTRVDSEFGARTGTLLGDVNGTTNIHVGNSGEGYLDVQNVAGCLVCSNFDTNSYSLVDGNSVNVADARLDTKASSSNSGAWPLSGIASIKTTAIPEPASLALVALGLLGLGALRRRA